MDNQYRIEGELVRCLPLATAAQLLGVKKRTLAKRGERGQHRRVRCPEYESWVYEVPEGAAVNSARCQEASNVVPNVAHLFDPWRKKPSYLVRNGPDGALVNVTSARVWNIAQSLAKSFDIADEFENRGLGADPKIRRGSLRVPPVGEKYLIQLSTRDVHIGEKGDPVEYEAELLGRIQGALEFAQRAHGKMDTILLTLGSDMATVDNAQLATTRGTQLHPEGSVFDIMRWTRSYAVNAVEVCRQFSDNVVCILEGGNHDFVIGYAMAMVVDAWFRGCDDVEVILPDDGGIRTYYSWGSCLFMGHHGHISKPTDLPKIMASEEPRLWGGADYRYILLGHRHHSQRWAMGDVGGCEIIQTRSPSPETDYEHRMGYVDDVQSLESFVFSDRRGMVTHHRS